MTWQLGLLTGGTGGLYFSTNAFIPDYLHAIGQPQLVTACLTALNTGQLPGSFLLLLAVRYLEGRRMTFIVMPLLAIVSIGGLLAPAGWAMVLGCGAIGFFGAMVLILTLALPPRLAAAGDVHRLSAGMFTIGYPLACAVPLLGGVLWDATRIPASAFGAAALSAAVVAAAATTLDRNLIHAR